MFRMRSSLQRVPTGSVLCGGRADTIPVAEQSLPRNICPLIKSSFGAVVDACCGGNLACPHVPLVDVVVAEATCDGKKKMYEILPDYLPTYVLDLPQKPGSPEALNYFLSELRKFGTFMEDLTGTIVSDDALEAGDPIGKRDETPPPPALRAEEARPTPDQGVRGSPGDAEAILPLSRPV